MPRSNARPKDRQRKTPKVIVKSVCACGGKATRFGLCVRCMDQPLNTLQLQTHGIYLPSRKERRTYGK